MTARTLQMLCAQRPASRPAAAAPTRRRRLSPLAALATLGYALAVALLLDVALRVW